VSGKRIEIRSWRVLKCDGGLFLFFDPTREVPRLFELEPGETSRVLTVVRGDGPELPVFHQQELKLHPEDDPHGS